MTAKPRLVFLEEAVWMALSLETPDHHDLLSPDILSFVLFRAVVLLYLSTGNGRPGFLEKHGTNFFFHRPHEVLPVRLCEDFSQVIHLVVSLGGIVYFGQDRAAIIYAVETSC